MENVNCPDCGAIVAEQLVEDLDFHLSIEQHKQAVARLLQDEG